MCYKKSVRVKKDTLRACGYCGCVYCGCVYSIHATKYESKCPIYSSKVQNIIEDL